ncbi:MAG: hypothetical protein AAGG09_23100 [Pseudomonadota bacterium]
MADALDTMQARQEETASAELSALLTRAVRADDVRQEAQRLAAAAVSDDDSGAAGAKAPGWPKDVTPEIRTLLQRTISTALARVRGTYRNYEVETELRARGGRPPEVRATAVYKVRRVAGHTHIIKSGETIRSVAKSHYGLVGYGNRVWEENRRTFGPSCRQIPAGFPVILPPADVPAWDRAPRVKPASGTAVKAVRILYPVLDLSIGGSTARKVAFATDAFSVEITCRFRGDVHVQRKGTIEPDFALKSYRGEAARILGDMMGGFALTAEEKRGTLFLRVAHKRARAISYTGQTRLATGGPKVRLTGSTEDVMHKEYALRFMAYVEAALRIVPRRTGKPVAKYETGLAVSLSVSPGGFGPRPLVTGKSNWAPAAERGAAAVLKKLGVA